jgi:HlyD family secretion protein
MTCRSLDRMRAVVPHGSGTADNVLTVTVGALIRKGDNWAVFAVASGLARTTMVQIGDRNNLLAEVMSGFTSGNRVLIHPSDRIKEGISVSARKLN